jgi:hypothetical protein
MLMLSTAAIKWVVAAMLGPPLRMRQTMSLSLAPLAIATHRRSGR